MHDEIVASIASAKKYRALYRPTIDRVVSDCLKRYGADRAEEEARSILHQIWGSYYPVRPDFKKLWEKFQTEVAAGNREQAIDMVLRLHTSSVERLPIFDEFYKNIFGIILREYSGQVLREYSGQVLRGYSGQVLRQAQDKSFGNTQDKSAGPLSIVDHGCCLDPVAFGRMLSVIASTEFTLSTPKGSNPSIQYQAFDIDVEEVDFLRKTCQLLGYGDQVNVATGDAIADPPIPADVVFMLKLLPVLEQQQKGSAHEVLLKQKAKWLVVSYPVASLSGKEKGMTEFYTKQFMEMAEGLRWKIERLLFPTELVFVVDTSPDNLS